MSRLMHLRCFGTGRFLLPPLPTDVPSHLAHIEVSHVARGLVRCADESASDTGTGISDMYQSVAETHSPRKLSRPWHLITDGSAAISGKLQPLLSGNCHTTALAASGRCLPPFLKRAYSSVTGSPPPGPETAAAKAMNATKDSEFDHSVLQPSSVSLQGLQEALKAEKRPILPIAELEQLCIQKGAAEDEAEARMVISSLASSGQLLQTGQWIYLRPEEVYEAVNKHIFLRDKPEHLEKRIADLEALLVPLRIEKEKMELGGQRRSNFVLTAILAGLAAQYAAVFRLTYWELSWDVMEPAAYFLQGASQILCLLYFMCFKTPFEYPAVVEQWKNRYMSHATFSQEELDKLEQELEHKRAVVASMAKHSSTPRTVV